MTYYSGWTVRNKSIFVLDFKGKGHYFCPDIQVTEKYKDICTGTYFLKIMFYAGDLVETVTISKKILADKFLPELAEKGFSLASTAENLVTLAEILLEQESCLPLSQCHTKLGYQKIKEDIYYFGKDETSGTLASTYVGTQELSLSGAFCEWQAFVGQEISDNPLLALPLAMGVSAPIATRD